MTYSPAILCAFYLAFREKMISHVHLLHRQYGRISASESIDARLSAELFSALSSSVCSSGLILKVLSTLTNLHH